MVTERRCINVWSDMNTWIDFCILVSDADYNEAKVVIDKAYDDWWELPDAQFEPIADYVCRCLADNGIEHEIYFKENDE